MKKLILGIVIALATINATQAQTPFFGVDQNKVVSLVSQAEKMPHDNAILIINTTFQALSNNPKAYRKALDTVLPRLSEPTDSMHNEELYITVLKHATSSLTLTNSEKELPKALLQQALKNKVGDPATDIDFVTTDGKKQNLLNNDNKYTLVYFNDPDCDACAKVKENLNVSETIKKAVADGKMRVVAINPMSNEKLWKKTSMPEWIVNGWNKSQSINNDGTYDLPTLPVFFLLSTDNTVLLKNEASLQRVEKVVEKILNGNATSAEEIIKNIFNVK